VGLELDKAVLRILKSKRNGHHPTRWAWNTLHNTAPHPQSKNKVTIPHGGLGTYWVGNEFRGSGPSPSHTVGLEPRLSSSTGRELRRSPSHTVGSEPACPLSITVLLMVTIPHGGLGT